MILLTDEEILEAMNRKPFDCVRHVTLSDGYADELSEIAKAQIEKIVEWGNERCPHFEGTIGGQTPTKRECYHCWQTLLDAVK